MLNDIATTPADFCYPAGLISVDQALDFMLKRARVVSAIENISLHELPGRVLSADLNSPLDVPGYDNSQMDGYAVRSAELRSGQTRLPISQYIPAGAPGCALSAGTAARIFTGAVIPAGADAVVMQENCEHQGNFVSIADTVNPGMNVRPRGNDIRTGDQVLRCGERLTPPAIGLSASLGVNKLGGLQTLESGIFFLRR